MQCQKCGEVISEGQYCLSCARKIASVHLNEAKSHCRFLEYERALKVCKKALEIYPDFDEARQLGEELDKKVAAFNELLSRAEQSYARGHYREVRRLYDEAVKIMPLPKGVKMRLHMIECAVVEEERKAKVEAARKRKRRFDLADFMDMAGSKKQKSKPTKEKEEAEVDATPYMGKRQKRTFTDFMNMAGAGKRRAKESQRDNDSDADATQYMGKRKQADDVGAGSDEEKGNTHLDYLARSRYILFAALVALALAGITLGWYNSRFRRLRMASQGFKKLVSKVTSGEYEKEQLRRDLEKFVSDFYDTPYAAQIQRIYLSGRDVLKGDVVYLLIGFMETASWVEEAKMLQRIEESISDDVSPEVKALFVEGIKLFKSQSYSEALESWVKSLEKATPQEKEMIHSSLKVASVLIQKTSREYQSWIRKAQEYEAKGRYRAAGQAYLRALEVRPQDKFALKGIDRLKKYHWQ